MNTLLLILLMTVLTSNRKWEHEECINLCEAIDPYIAADTISPEELAAVLEEFDLTTT